MKTSFRIFSVLVAIALLVWLATPLYADAGAPSGKGIVPEETAGNPTCGSFNEGWIQLKLEPVPNGVHVVSDGLLSVTVAAYSTPFGQQFDWESNIGVSAVFAKGGPGGNLYRYDPEETGDTGLHAPLGAGPGGSQYFGLSHISFCYDVELQVSKDAHTSLTRTYEWTIDKTVTPATWDLFTGDSGASKYTVSVDKTTTDSDWAVNGTISIYNPHPSKPATILGVTDSVDGIPAAVDCGVTFPYQLAKNGTLTCIYQASLPDATERTNTATVTTSGPVGGGSGTAEVDFTNASVTEVGHSTVTVDDSVVGALGAFSDDDSTSYSRTFTCDGDEGTHENTATINETDQSDSASVTVNCYGLTVTKNAKTSFTRTWAWTIDKSADQTSLKLSEGQLLEVKYDVTVDATSTDSAFAVNGDIWIANSHPTRDAELTTVSDIVSPDIAATVNCPSLTVPADSSLHCTYSASLPDAADRLNTATASLQNYAYDSAGLGTPSGTSDFSGTANVDFSGATIDEVDECVEVTDDNIGVGSLGAVCAGDADKTFTYKLMFGTHPDADVPLECGDNTHTNIASFETNDTGATGSDNEVVTAQVACVEGCTLTQGYWKTHSSYGPAPYDDTWALIGEDTPFFSSGKSYYQVLWTPPAGNAYYILAHQYIAAKLNQLNGAVFTDAQAAFDAATTLFNTYTPDQVAALKGNHPDRKLFTSLASTLDKYNNGLIGPGHCSEDCSSGARSLDTEAANLLFLPFVRR